ncbi:MAG: CoA-acylating methylmalonate-semialdehyde dehydrogenase [Bacteroidetes bacterium]|nr:CoA-acylating methylmalonate-semialdehyde dehydrogenase [Bacteroidota bacterium]
MKYKETKNFINGAFTTGHNRKIDVINPADGQVISTVPLSDKRDLDEAVAAARNAYMDWGKFPVKMKAEIFYNYRSLLEKNMEELSSVINTENGKTMDESIAEVKKCIELTEFACSMPQLIQGEILEVSRGVECRTEYNPVGVVSSITPFNFPLMVPHWTAPNAMMLGNCMVLKPSEVTPVSMMRMAELLKEAGLPDGVFNIVNGDREMVEEICDHPGIKAISFVGSTRVAQIVYRRATSNLKRCLALGGAKNHLLVFPDAHTEMTAQDIAASMTGAAGQRCMAASVMIAVGNTDHIIGQLCSEVRKFIPGKNLGPIITRESLNKLEAYITHAETEGARILVDGRNFKVQGKKNGTWLGPTIIDYSTNIDRMPKEEVFGPVFEIVHVKNLDEAIAIENESPFGNAATVFTQSGKIMHEVMRRVSAGMCGVNIGVPVPREPFSFGGWNDSKFGVGDITGKSSLEFWSQLKKITTKWNKEDKVDWMS